MDGFHVVGAFERLSEPVAGSGNSWGDVFVALPPSADRPSLVRLSCPMVDRRTGEANPLVDKLRTVPTGAKVMVEVLPRVTVNDKNPDGFLWYIAVDVHPAPANGASAQAPRK